MNYVIFDLEWNQPFHHDVSFLRRTHMHITGEIIQIGAVKLNEELEIVDTFTTIIRPKYLRQMNQHVKKLTGMTTEDIEQGVPFLVGYGMFDQWCGEDAVLLSWGMDDIVVLKDNLLLHGLSTKLERTWYDAQLLYAKTVHQNNKQCSLQKAMTEVGVSQEGLEAHDALHDSIFTVRIMQKIDWKAQLPTYEKMVASMPPLFTFAEPLSFILSRLYDDKRDIWKEKRMLRCYCPMCREMMQVSRREHVSGDKFLALAICEEHGDFAVQWRVGKHENRVKQRRFFASQMIVYSDTEIERFYQERAAQNRIKEEKYLEKQARKKARREANQAADDTAQARKPVA